MIYLCFCFFSIRAQLTNYLPNYPTRHNADRSDVTSTNLSVGNYEYV